jgi:predicted MFS family arabinose efflux permease
MLALVYGLSNASSHGWSSLSTLISLAASVVLLVAFGLIERRSAEPLMPLSIFSNRNRSASFAVMLCIGIALFALFYFLTLYLQNILGWSAIRTGVGFLPMTFGIIIAAGLTSQLVSKIGVRVPLIAGSGATVVGMLWITRITVTSSYLDILGPLIVIALGLGFVFVPLTLTAVSGVKANEAGLASALLNTMQQIGGAIGLAVLATVAFDATNSEEHGVRHLSTTASNIATTHGYTIAFFVSAGIAFIAFVISVAAIHVPKETLGDASPLAA